MLSNLFRAADLDSQFCCFLKQAANEVPSKPLPLVREQVTNLCINALFSYRKYCATVSSSGQLILPEALKLLPLYRLALTKITGLRTEGKIDDWSFWINYVSSLFHWQYHLCILGWSLPMEKLLVGPGPPCHPWSRPIISQYINVYFIFFNYIMQHVLLLLAWTIDNMVVQDQLIISPDLDSKVY